MKRMTLLFALLFGMSYAALDYGNMVFDHVSKGDTFFGLDSELITRHEATALGVLDSFLLGLGMVGRGGYAHSGESLAVDTAAMPHGDSSDPTAFHHNTKLDSLYNGFMDSLTAKWMCAGKLISRGGMSFPNDSTVVTAESIFTTGKIWSRLGIYSGPTQDTTTRLATLQFVRDSGGAGGGGDLVIAGPMIEIHDDTAGHKRISFVKAVGDTHYALIWAGDTSKAGLRLAEKARDTARAALAKDSVGKAGMAYGFTGDTLFGKHQSHAHLDFFWGNAAGDTYRDITFRHDSMFVNIVKAGGTSYNVGRKLQDIANGYADSSKGGATRATTAATLQGKDTAAVKTFVLTGKAADATKSDSSAKTGAVPDSCHTTVFQADRFRGALTGNVTGDVTGNAATADKADTALAYVPAAPDSTLPIRGDGAAAWPVGIEYKSDFLFAASTSANPPWVLAVIASGTYDVVNGSATHPGVARYLSSTSANSGDRIIIQEISLMLAGSEVTDCVFRPETLTNSTFRFGFHNAINVNVPSDGVYFQASGTTLRGRTANDGNRDSTASTYTLASNRWCWLRVALNSNATRAYFTVRDSVGALSYSDSVSTYIPTTRVTGHGLVVTNSGTTAYPLLDLDYMNLRIARKICAGSPR